MRKLSELLYAVDYKRIIGDDNREVNELVFDSRKANSNSMFFAIVGANHDGHDFISTVVKNGCTVVVVNKELELIEGLTQIVWYLDLYFDERQRHDQIFGLLTLYFPKDKQHL